MSKIVLVGLGGFFGSMARYLISSITQQTFASTGFPFGTMLVNILGCLLIGALASLAETRNLLNAETQLFLIVGLLGGFTTFSAFAHETHLLAHAAGGFKAFANVGVHILVGLAAVWLGSVAGRML